MNYLTTYSAPTTTEKIVDVLFACSIGVTMAFALVAWWTS